jgi:hypothetical protein
MPPIAKVPIRKNPRRLTPSQYPVPRGPKIVSMVHPSVCVVEIIPATVWTPAAPTIERASQARSARV